jgi:hypothetical protein
MTQVTIGPINGLALSTVVVNSTSGTIAAPAGVTGKIIRVYKLFLVVGGTTNITFQDGTTALSGPVPLIANGSITLDMDGQAWFTTSVGNAFNIGNSGSSVQVSGTVYYTANNS